MKHTDKQLLNEARSNREAACPPAPLAPNWEAFMSRDPTCPPVASELDEPNEGIFEEEFPCDENEEGAKEWVLEGHICRAEFSNVGSQGYGHAIETCMEDVNGRLWLVDPNGRKQTQAKFCPFCGCQALEDTPPAKSDAITAVDIALVAKDTPQAQWRVYDRKTIVKMSHFQFGSVRVLASNGCHAKVLTHDKVQLTVCVENLEMIKGVPCIPKMGEKVEKKVKKTKEVDLELLDKYLSMGLD